MKVIAAGEVDLRTLCMQMNPTLILWLAYAKIVHLDFTLVAEAVA